MRTAAAPVLSALIVAGTCALAISSKGTNATHGFPDASRRPPLKQVLDDAAGMEPSGRLMAARILGFYRSERAFFALEKLVTDRDPLIRLAALRGVMLQNHPRSVAVIQESLDDDPEDLVRHRAEFYLDMLQNPLGNVREP